MPLSKNKEKYIRNLSLKKNRQVYNNFIAEGTKLAHEILTTPNILIEAIFAQKGWVLTNKNLLIPHETIVEQVTQQELKQISQLTTPNQVLIIAKQPDVKLNTAVITKDWSLYLDRIQDPGNMGTILRIANWFGIEHVFCSPDSVEVYNFKVVQASMGAFLRVKVIPIEFELLKQQFPEVPTYAALLEGRSVFQPMLSATGIIVMGNEGQGLSPSILAQVDYPITIPAYGTHDMESLNVAVSTGIICAALRNPLMTV